MANDRKNYYRKKRILNKGQLAGRIVLLLFLAAMLFTVGLFCYAAYRLTGTVVPTAELWDGKPTIRFVDVGQGDCTLVTYQGYSVLIDAGPGSSADLAAEYVRTYAPEVDYFIITHPHEDHMGGAAEILRNVRVGTLVMSEIAGDDLFYEEAVAAAEQRGTQITAVRKPFSCSAGEIQIEILDTFGFPYEDLNDASLITRVTVGETTLLITGDAEEGEEAYLLEKYTESLDCDILKVGHHGSKTSTTQPFLEAASPEICVISVGRGNSFGHPAEEVTTRITAYGAEIRRTDREGHVVLRGETTDSHGLLDIWKNIWYH